MSNFLQFPQTFYLSKYILLPAKKASKANANNDRCITMGATTCSRFNGVAEDDVALDPKAFAAFSSSSNKYLLAKSQNLIKNVKSY